MREQERDLVQNFQEVAGFFCGLVGNWFWGFSLVCLLDFWVFFLKRPNDKNLTCFAEESTLVKD